MSFSVMAVCKNCILLFDNIHFLMVVNILSYITYILKFISINNVKHYSKYYLFIFLLG